MKRYVGVRKVYSKPWTFKQRVRDIVIAEEGIHTIQRVYSGVVQWDSNGRGVKGVEIMTTQYFSQLLVLNDGTREQAKIRSAQSTYVFSNGNNYPVRITTYECVCRKNTKDIITTLLADQSVNQKTPMIDPTVGTAFRRYFKILHRKHMYLQAGQPTEITCRQFYPAPRTITGDVEQNLTYTYTTGAKVILCYFEGIPSEDTNAAASVGLSFGKINYVAYDKCTFYYDEDNDPITSAKNELPIYVAGQTFRIYTDVQLVPEATDGP